MVPAKRNSWKSTLEKREYGKEFLFLQELESNSLGFLELKSQIKGTQKRMHNLGKTEQVVAHWWLLEASGVTLDMLPWALLRALL
jgi:hypothetical protein